MTARLTTGSGIGFQRACVILEREDNAAMKSFTAVVERDSDTGLLVGYVPGFPGAHSQAESLDELQANLREVIALLLEDGERNRLYGNVS
jgi:predicted RNase H-like HicB family nuclease